MSATPAADLGQLLNALAKPTALIELGVFAGCLVLAALLVRLLRGPAASRPGSSIWYGERIVDGVLFPLLALVLALLARWLIATLEPERLPIAVFKVVVPVLVSLAAIRLTVRVLHATFPDSALMRAVERSVSWVAWLVVLLALPGGSLRAAAMPSSPQPAISEAASINYLGAETDGTFLVVSYSINFPGVTKIRMYSDNLTVLYRGQFLDREKGDQKIYLRLDRMASGYTYYFELEYKGIIRSFSYTVP